MLLVGGWYIERKEQEAVQNSEKKRPMAMWLISSACGRRRETGKRNEKAEKGRVEEI